MSLMDNCKKFGRCSASICPLDTGASTRVFQSYDDVCMYCRSQKHNGRRREMPKDLLKLVPKMNIRLLSENNRSIIESTTP